MVQFHIGTSFDLPAEQLVGEEHQTARKLSLIYRDAIVVVGSNLQFPGYFTNGTPVSPRKLGFGRQICFQNWSHVGISGSVKGCD